MGFGVGRHGNFGTELGPGTDTYVGLEKRLARKLYARSYWAREEYGRNVRVPGAVGVDFKFDGNWIDPISYLGGDLRTVGSREAVVRWRTRRRSNTGSERDC